MYYVEIPATWVDEELRAVAEEQLAETRDLFGLPGIRVRWIRNVGKRASDVEIPYQDSCRVFMEMGRPQFYPLTDRCSNGVLGRARPGLPYEVELRSEPEAYRRRRCGGTGDLWTHVRQVVIHECVHCYQGAAGYAKQMTRYEHELMAYGIERHYPFMRKRLLLARRMFPGAFLVATPLIAKEWSIEGIAKWEVLHPHPGSANVTWAEPSGDFLYQARVTFDDLVKRGAVERGHNGSVWLEYAWVPSVWSEATTLTDDEIARYCGQQLPLAS